MVIRLVKKIWLINGKRFSELTPNEITILDNMFSEYKNRMKLKELEKKNKTL
jgi:oligoribonuclease NrnB/cAMP/cGMP phosphodiesterase (DHH superfamily)